MDEFLPACGVVGLGRLIGEGNKELIEILRRCASDVRWRFREAVAIALQRYGETDMTGLLYEMEEWSRGRVLEKRAVVAALCEPKLLKQPAEIKRIMNILNKITHDVLKEENRKNVDLKVLRKALGYGWSVAVVASPQQGKEMLEKWFAKEDKDIRWIMKENLRKDRLARMDPEWTKQWKLKLGMS